MNDEDICTCGDYRKDHTDGTGECELCRWAPSDPKKPCKEFRLFGKEEKEE